MRQPAFTCLRIYDLCFVSTITVACPRSAVKRGISVQTCGLIGCGSLVPDRAATVKLATRQDGLHIICPRRTGKFGFCNPSSEGTVAAGTT